MKKLIFSIAILIAGAFPAISQSAEKISEILSSDGLTFGQLSYLVGTCGQGLNDKASYKEAFNFIKKKGFIADGVSENDKANVAQAAGLFFKSSGQKGGLMYRILGCDRYAFKELRAKGAIPQNVDPSMKIQGRDALALLSETLETE